MYIVASLIEKNDIKDNKVETVCSFLVSTKYGFLQIKHSDD